MKIALIDFSGNDALSHYITGKGHKVMTETSDGGRAYKTAGEALPELIVIEYAHKPSHGRQTAMAIHQRKRTAHIPILFVNGSEPDQALVASIGQCINSNELPRYL